jgi:uncharacterized membrane protein YhaH (DUF805 family)
MGFGQAVASMFANYFNFSGRSGRPEFWYSGLFLVVAGLLAILIDAFVFGYGLDYLFGPAYVVYALATIIPSIAVAVRRLHDIGRSGWWSLVAFTGVGLIVLVYWSCLPGEPGANQYGRLQPA